jgi:LacI family transcriptional regulator/LacI family repressor for deo operon, udp, cdd, tsx, nupC, and nupG
MRRRSDSPTIRDVARLAGVGVGTVSRVLNGNPHVSARAYTQVQDAMEQLGYRRSFAARSLAVGRSQLVGVVAPFFTTPSTIERLRGIVDHLAVRGYDVVVSSVQTADDRTRALRDFARHDRVDGLLWISLPVMDAEVAAMQHDGLPVVLIGVAHPEIAHVVVDDVRGGEIAGEHLVGKGHRRVGFVGDATVDAFGAASSERRLVGLRRALARPAREGAAVVATCGRYGREEARALAAELLERADPPTAVFAASDIQAFGVLEAATALGLRVPADLAVIGFDDIEMAATMGLTTVRQPLFESGTMGADLILTAIEGGERPAARHDQPLTLVERRTT